jgi:hypothetical protein
MLTCTFYVQLDDKKFVFYVYQVFELYFSFAHSKLRTSGRAGVVMKLIVLLIFFFSSISSSTTESQPSVPFARLRIQCDRYWPIAGHQCEEDQLEARLGLGQTRSVAQTVQFATGKGHDRCAKQWLCCV